MVSVGELFLCTASLRSRTGGLWKLSENLYVSSFLYAVFQENLPVKLLGTRFEARNCICEPGSQKLSYRDMVFETPCNIIKERVRVHLKRRNVNFGMILCCIWKQIILVLLKFSTLYFNTQVQGVIHISNKNI
jgi:hypothetical protein